MYDDLYNENVDFGKKRVINFKLFYIILACVIFITFCFLFFNRNNNDVNKYDLVYNDILNRASDYVLDYNISDNGVYLDSVTLGVSELYDCYNISGAIYENGKILPYLVCDGFKSDIVDNSIDLIGDEVLFIGNNDIYYEYGFNSNYDVRINNNIGFMNGVYNVYYTVIKNNNIDSVNIRKVIRVDDSLVNNLFPSISVSDNNMFFVNDNINIYDFKASDIIDGDITNSIIVSGSVLNRVGEYNISYSVTNSRGFSRIINKTFIVSDNSKLLDSDIYYLVSPSNLTSDSVNIMFSINSDSFSYCLLPDGSISYSKNFNYLVNSNGDYLFKVVDKNNNFVIKSVSVNNIHKIDIGGSCKYSVRNGILNIDTFSNGSYFNYLVDGFESGFINSSSYSNNVIGSNVRVMVKDNYGNSNIISCDKEEIKYVTDSLKRISFKNNYFLVANTYNDIISFSNFTLNNIAQNVDSKYYSSCLAFSEYHAVFLSYNDMYSMKSSNVLSSGVSKRFSSFSSSDYRVIMNKIFDEITNNRVVVLMVNGNGGRHFVTVVGFKDSVSSGDTLESVDLLILDSWDGKLESMDKSIEKSNPRYIYKQSGNYNLRVFK